MKTKMDERQTQSKNISIYYWTEQRETETKKDERKWQCKDMSIDCKKTDRRKLKRNQRQTKEGHALVLTGWKTKTKYMQNCLEEKKTEVWQTDGTTDIN